MESLINRTYLSAVRLTLCAGMVLLASCTKDELSSSNFDRRITFQARVPSLGMEQESSFESRASADPAQAMTLYFVRSDETGPGTGLYGGYGTTVLSATRSAGSGVTALSFATPEYYVSNNACSRFTGWWPAATSFSGGVVGWTMDGSQDILTASVQEGSVATPLPTFSFEHRLSRLNFELVAKSASVIASWGTVSAVNILSQPTTCTYTPATDASTGSVSMSGSKAYAAKNFASGVLTTTAVARGDAMFIASGPTDVVLSLSVVSSIRGTVPVTVAARSYEAGKAYKLTLSFEHTTLTAAVVPWDNVATDDNMGAVRIGDLQGGGIVYQVTDAKSYKVLSLDEGSGLKWSAQQTYVLGAAGQSDVDGNANVAAMQGYSVNTAANSTTGIFATDFPAADFCARKNRGGVTGWYLPAKDELVALYTAYRANKSVIDAGLANNSGTAFSTSAGCWSSTENSYGTSDAWAVSFSNGYTGCYPKSDGFVRCVRFIVSPTTPNPPASTDYVEIDGLKWTKGPLVAVNATNCKVGSSTDYGVYFQFGSLVGWSGGASGDGTGATNTSLGVAVQVKPSTYGGTYAWGTVGRYTAAGTSGTGNGLPATDAPTTGIGDPCRFYLGAPWRTPTAGEYIALCNNKSGADANFPWSDVGGSWTTTPVNGGTLAGAQLFFPASGFRHTSSGSFNNVTTNGYGWSSSVSSATYGYSLNFGQLYGVIPQNSNTRSHGFPVRCVSGTYVPSTKPNPPASTDYVEIDGLQWAKGNLVAVDGINCKVGSSTDYGVYFQFGSLVGWQGGATGDGTGVTNTGLGVTVQVKPSTYVGTAAWGTVGRYLDGTTDDKGYNLPATDAPTTGIGDPCRFYLGAPWRTPTAGEYKTLFANVNNGTAWGSVSGWNWQASPAGAIGPSSLFFPASGTRTSSNGSFYSVTTDGYYWSSSVYSATNGYNLGFRQPGGVIPQNYNNRSNGFPVRCVSSVP